ncbi:hypothetical protein BDZ91DRAFT_740768, partial [Kalaharituber pfeilii]
MTHTSLALPYSKTKNPLPSLTGDQSGLAALALLRIEGKCSPGRVSLTLAVT